NTLALRVDLAGSPTVAELLAHVRERALGAQQNQDIPFEQVVEVVQPVRSLAHEPLFQVMLGWQNTSEGRVEVPGLRPGGVGPAGLASGSASEAAARFDLSLDLSEQGGRIVGSVTYATSLFDQATVERHVGYLRHVLEAMVADERQPVDRLALLTESERRHVLEAWNRTEAEYPAESCIHEIFQAQAERTPNAEAVVFEDHSLTYAELNARANRLAHHLRSLGVGAVARVAVCVERSAEMVVALLAVMKAGGAYVPLDPAQPAERLEYMLADSAPASVLTQKQFRDRFEHTGVPVLEIDAGRPEWADQPATEPAMEGLAPAHLAYVIYTSGSTGRPKGVAVPHRGVVNLLRSMRETVGMEPADRLLAVTTYAFDISVLEMFLPLLHGAATIVLPRERSGDPAALAEAIRAYAPTVMQATPATWRMLVSAQWEGAPEMRALCGGEALPADLASAVRSRVAALWNVYGPTETTIWSTSQAVRSDSAAANVPIGRPVANTRVYVLDGAGEPVPVGVAGELYIGGAGVVRGYLGRPEQTAERFVADPFGGEPGARLYRTGDLARWRVDGTMEFLGRTDFQVKVRGFRIELGEIEARLAEHADVREAAVMAREDVPGDVRLVAYVVGEADAESLRAHLSTALPEYMIPAAYVRLEALPLTPNGKLDRKALPAPEGDAYASREYEAPLGAAEEALAEIWADVLRVDRVSRWANFFELGGHSLLAVRVVSRVRQVLDVEVPLGELFRSPVLADFARGLATAVQSELPPIEPVDRGGPLPLSFPQQRLWFLEQLGDLGSTYHVTTHQRLRGELDAGALGRALDAIVARHEALRTTVVEVEGEPVQRIAPVEESRFPLAEHDLSAHPQAQSEARRLLAEETRTPFDLSRGPLVRGLLIRLAKDDHVLHVTMHHMVTDGWSMGVFTRELGALYGAFRRGEPDPLPALPVQYADYAAWQRRWADGDALNEQADYWRATLGGAPALLELPTDRPRPAQVDHAGAALGVVMDEALTAGLKALGQRHGTTLFMTVLAGWAAVLGRLSGQDDVVVGTPTANRGRIEIEGLIGFFVNTLALRVDLAGSPSVAELLTRVKERALGAQQNQDIPFEQVVEVVQPVRSLAHEPLFQVMLGWENTSEGRVELPGLRPGGVGTAGSAGSPGSASEAAARFDLSLDLSEQGGRIVGSVTYATSLFDQATVERHVGYLRHVLEAMVADERQPVEGLALLSADERTQVLEAWNRTAGEYPADRCIHELFQAQAERTPNAEAVVFEDRSLTYAELNARANRLAHHLRERGVGPDARVAVCVERSAEMVVALLAVMKAGGAYVPLDPSYPAERLRYVLDDSAPAAVLTQRSLEGVETLFADVEAPVIDLEGAEWADQSATEPAIEGLTPAHLAYVIYTSGSTGRPKGVAVPHRGVVNLLRSMRETVGVEAADRLLAVTTYAFDISVLEMFLPLLHGAATIVLPRERAADPAALAEAIRAYAPTVMQATPATWRMLVSAEWEGAPEMRALCGGEALPADLASAVRSRVGALWNVYGPTETTIWSTSGAVGGDASSAAQVPIGRPVANTRVYVLDAAGE
ncbi:amino acid adenylation domain-containing protein, partial [Longimicrobium sp.]|uniref:amino acid adenylation domain-containing protein n=1 Tax=Longimicrobium sp. TaxID=2029185 RepID=UPI002ED7D690